jgi:hypothetical protein
VSASTRIHTHRHARTTARLEGAADVILTGLARIVGIVAVFAIVGPLAFAVQVLLMMIGFGAPLIELLKLLLRLEVVSTLMSVAVSVLVIGAMLAAIPPSAITGFIFALAAVCTGLNAVWAAWLAAAGAIAGIMVLRLFIIPAQSSAVILPSAQTAGQAVALFLTLNALAILPTALCWWFARALLPIEVAT